MAELKKTETKKKSRYRHAEGKRWIEVSVNSITQIFDARDPAPFRERDLDDDFVEYVLSAAREFSHSTPLKLVIYISQSSSTDLPKDAIRDAIRDHFAYQIELRQSELRNYWRRAQLYLLIGILILVACLSISQNLSFSTNTLEPSGLKILREGIVIFGWVSMWKPLELLLFDWYPLYETLRLHKKMIQTEIDIRLT